MSPEILFSIGSTLALAGWAVLATGIALRHAWLRDILLVAVGAGSDHVLNLDQKAGMQACLLYTSRCV